MTMDDAIRLAPLFGPIIAAAVAVAGWFTAHWFSSTRDRNNKRNDMITKYLLEAYRRLEMTSNRDHNTEEQILAFESAIADIQLLGSMDQVSVTLKFSEAYVETMSGNMNPILCKIRDDLREKLKLGPITTPPKIFRFKRKAETLLP